MPTRRLEEAQACVCELRQQRHPHGRESGFRSLGAEEEKREGSDEEARGEEQVRREELPDGEKEIVLACYLFN